MNPQPWPAGYEGVTIELHTGARNELRHLFELAEDSATELDSYLHTGRVLVARSGQVVLGHLQLVETDRPGQSNGTPSARRRVTRPGSRSTASPCATGCGSTAPSARLRRSGPGSIHDAGDAR